MMTVFGPYIYLYIHIVIISNDMYMYTLNMYAACMYCITVMTSSSKTTIRPMVSPTDCRNPHRKYLVCLNHIAFFVLEIRSGSHICYLQLNSSLKKIERWQIPPVLCVLEQFWMSSYHTSNIGNWKIRDYSPRKRTAEQPRT